MTDVLNDSPDIIAATAAAVSDQLAEIVAAAGSNPVPAEQVVTAVVAAYNHVGAGDPVGTIRRDPITDSTAFRVLVGGVAKWSVTDGQTGAHHYDMGHIDWPIYPPVSTPDS
ncbi:hypothetical protein B1R94_02370 [Mycolicibacterium litorale]|nr:hypothetical protein B1R94_02370 [Mycolicibacterium litorale]